MSSALPNPLPSFNVLVTKEQFNLFYSVDRQLFTRLMVGLGRDTSQSINVMAFLMWVEWKSKDDNLVAKILQRWSDVMLSSLADEVVSILNFIESSHFPDISVGESNLPLIQHILRRNVTLEFFHGKRLDVINGVTKFINDVCVRAFTDIIEQVHHDRAMKEQELYLASIYGATNLSAHFQPQVVYFDPNVVPMIPQQIVAPLVNNAPESYDVSLPIERDMSEILANLNSDDIYAPDTGIVAPIGNDDDKMKEIKQSVDDRTLFMTFSKGYPVYENELREFFIRKFGNIIENLIMQEANPPEQSLYARLVVRREAIDIIDHFLGYNPRMKFSINGKHVWVRKYVRKLPFQGATTSRYSS